MGYFYWLRLKSSNHLHTELSYGYLKDTKFYIESKASFNDISSIASFKPFLTTWLRKYCTFLDSSAVNLSTRLAKIRPVGNYFPRKQCSIIKLFFLFKYVLHLTVLSKYLEKKIGGHRARLREKENLFRYRAQFEGNLSRFARARARVRALMTQKSCAVGMRNAILRNYLKGNFVRSQNNSKYQQNT